MRYVPDHDLHIHTHLSPCSGDPEQTTARILQYGVEHGLTHLCVTDHFWDETVPGGFGWAGLSHTGQNLPLPQAEGLTFHFGGEADMNLAATVGLSKKTAEKLDFIAVPTTHMHIIGFPKAATLAEEMRNRREAYIARWRALLDSDLPFHKMGLAHITWAGFASRPGEVWEDHMAILDAIPDDVFKELFAKTEQKGMGVELNISLEQYSEGDLPRILRVYRLAVECGCHFYFGSDAHHPAELNAGYARFDRLIDLLHLDEEQKFRPFDEH